MNNTQIKSAPLPERSIEHLTRCTVLRTSDKAHYMPYPALHEAGYAASCPNVKSNLIALYGNTIFPWSSWSMTPAFSSACTSRCTPRKSRPMRRASSRIDTAPVPVMALMICNRPTPNMTLVSDSTSGNVRENGTSTACPDIAATKDFSVSSNDSLADITRTTSVLITLPPEYVHIVVKLADKVIQPGDRDGKFTVADVLMVTLSGFVVVAHNTYILNDISEAVFVVVLASPDRWIDYPYRDTGESVLIREVVTFFNEQISRHVFSPFDDDNYDINICVMSTMSSKALDRLNCWRYAYPAPYKTGAGRGNPKLIKATPDAASVFFVVRYTRHSMAWCMSFNANSAAAITHNGIHHAAHNGAMCAPYDGLLSGSRSRNSTSRRPRMVTLAGLPKGRPVPFIAGISTPVNVTAPIERGNSSGDSLNQIKEAVYHG